jgi:hypothetical protein
VTETIVAYGHENIRATHKTTLEITKETDLSKKGDCIIAVAANKGLADLSRRFKEALCKEDAKLTIQIRIGRDVEAVKASGSPHLTLVHPTDFVVRKSNYVCGRTLAIQTDKAACGISRELVGKLQNPKQKVTIILSVNV